MNILDIVLICIFVLFALIGLIKGFFSTLVSFLGSVLSFTGAFFLAKPLASLFNSWFGLSTTLGNNISSQIVGMFEDFVLKMTGAEILETKCSATGFLKMAFQFLINPEEYYSKEEIVTAIGNSAGNLILMAICLIVAYLLIKLVLFVLSKIFNKLKRESKAVSLLDRILGLVIGACKAFLIIAVVCVLVNLMQSIPAVSNALDTVMNGSVIGKPIYDFVSTIYEKYLVNIDFNSLVTNAKAFIR